MTLVQPTHNLSLEELDRESMFHPYTALADHLEKGVRVISEGSGVWVKDPEGKRFLDAVAGLWCVNIGYGRTEVADAIHEQAKKLAYFHSFSSMGTEPTIRLADRLLRLAPEGMSKVLFGNTGSDANDTNVKLIWYYNTMRGKPDKVKLIARKQGYHGVTVASASLTGLPLLHKAFHLPIPEVRHVSCPDPYRGKPDGMSERDFSKQLAKELDETIEREGPDTVAAFFAEPVMGAGGVHVPPEGYFDEIQPVLKKHDVLLVADEVICGFGRLGRWFGSDLYGIKPDIMTIAKGLTSGYVPMSASLVGDKVWDVLIDTSKAIGPFGHGYTYGGHPVAAAAAMANLDIFERDDLVGNAAEVGAYFQARARETLADHPLVGHVRGVGLILGIEFVADKASKRPFEGADRIAPKVSEAAHRRGLLARPLPGGDIIALSPPLSITRDEVDVVFDHLRAAVEEVAEKR
ncbi:MAG: aminotransferase [Alphaproteobacteria bacterium]